MECVLEDDKDINTTAGRFSFGNNVPILNNIQVSTVQPVSNIVVQPTHRVSNVVYSNYNP